MGRVLGVSRALCPTLYSPALSLARRSIFFRHYQQVPPIFPSEPARHRIEQARREFEALNEELRNELTQANNAIAQLTARQQDLENQAERLSKEKSEQNQSLEDVRVNLANAESQRDEALTRANDLKESVSELKQENRDIRDHFEHYQQRTAEDRQQEREQFHLVSRGLKDQIQDLQLRLSQADSKASELVDANERLQRHTHELEQANAIQKGTLDRQVADIQKLEYQLNDASAKSREQQHKSEQLVDNIAVLTNQKAGDCCVYCSYGSVPCPPIQLSPREKGGCCK